MTLIAALTLEEVRCFVQQQLLASFQLEAFAHGNIEKEVRDVKNAAKDPTQLLYACRLPLRL